MAHMTRLDWISDITRIDSPDRGRWAVLVGGGVLVRCRTKSEARRLWAQNCPSNPYVVRALRRWRRK